MFCSVRKHWQEASTLALAFACISACQNVSFALEAEKSTVISQANRTSGTELIGLEAQAATLTLDSKSKPPSASLSIATEVSPQKSMGAKTSPSAGAKSVTTTRVSDAKPSQNRSKVQTLSKLKTTVSSAPKASKTTTTAETSPVKQAQSSNEQTKKTSDSKADGTATTKVTKTTRKARKRTVMLVPPPPPTMPTYLNSPISGSFDLGLSVNYMSLDDLKFQQKTLEKKLESAKLDEQDQKRSTDEKKVRAQKFVELYEEGVVSRRELETAKEESERSARAIEQMHIKVSEIERVLGQVNQRINSMQAAKQPFKVSSKKSKTR